MKTVGLIAAAIAAQVFAIGVAEAAPSERAQKVFEFWNAERVAKLKPRDMVIDERGLSYMRDFDGKLTPYGHSVRPLPKMGPGNGGGNGGGGGGKVDDGVVSNAGWGFGGAVQTAAGRILFEMGTGNFFICSGTAVTDGTTGRSVILTAAHCVYDDAAKAFATNVLFIPNQDGTTGAGTDFDCFNDPLGCWAPSIGVVEQNWAINAWPDNIPWDYAYYVVDDTGAHSGNGSAGALDVAAGTLPIDFLQPFFDDGDNTAGSLDSTHGLGYSGSDDPNFMYCVDHMTTQGADNWWLAECGLSGGSSGGPWVQPMDEATGFGPVISVNSWGFARGRPIGMAGPLLSGTTAQCVFDAAKVASLNSPGGGFIVDPGTCPN